MGKKVFAVLVLMLFVAGSVAFAGGACGSCGQPSPCNTNACGTPKSCGTPARVCDPSIERADGPYKRDVLGNRVPVFTQNQGTWHNDAAGTHSHIISGADSGTNT